MARWYRLLLTFLLSFFRPRILITDATTLFFRVLPFEADFKYMNNASFWTIAEMGIMDIYFRSGAFRVCRSWRVLSKKCILKNLCNSEDFIKPEPFAIYQVNTTL